MVSCGCHRISADEAFARAYADYLHGYLSTSQREAQKAYEIRSGYSAEWQWRFRILAAKAALSRGLYSDVFRILQPVPASPNQPKLAIPKLTLVGVAEINTHKFSDAKQSLNDAAKLCAQSDEAECGYLIQAQGLLASELAQSASAEAYYKQSLRFARSHHDSFLEANSLLNLGDEFLSREHFDEAIDQSEAGYRVASAEDAKVLQLVIQGNIAWAYYNLGDFEKALDMSVAAQATAVQLGDVFDQQNQLTNIGYIYMERGEWDLAQRSFQQALALAESIKADRQIYNALRVLARLSLRTGNLDSADQYARRALANAQKTGTHEDELYPVLIQGKTAAKRSDFSLAQRMLEGVQADHVCPVSLKWEAQHSLAQLYEAQKQLTPADREYRSALATFENARGNLHHEDFQLSFLTNAAAIYDDYVTFLISQGKTEEALRWADYSRGRTLSEGLGVLPKPNPGAVSSTINLPPLDTKSIGARAKGAVLYYWLGEKQSYLWAITGSNTVLLRLPPAAEINSMAERYRKALIGPRDPLESSNEDGRALYRALVAPARDVIGNNKKVFIVADGSLNSLNFETLIVDTPKPHYWIEDAEIINASSLRLLAASFPVQHTNQRRLLLIGDSVPSGSDYPALPQAASELADVAGYFPPSQRQVYAKDQATPGAYLDSNPERFSYIHFVAHGTASRLSPLDSAIVLSRDAANSDSFKLYARDIVKHPLRAELVTISSCYGAGERAYSGEGLVGLAWAFLRAGAHYVVAALWEASDSATTELMDQFYRGLKSGKPADVSLHDAKISLLRSQGVFRKPFYWAPFQLYTGRDSTNAR